MIKQSLRLHPMLDTPIARWLAVAAWMALIFALSAQSRLPSPDDPWIDFLFKKAAHFTVYGVLAFLFWRALPPGRLIYLWAWALSTLYACTDELHQSLTPLRHPSPWDVVIDACGAATALLILWQLKRRTT